MKKNIAVWLAAAALAVLPAGCNRDLGPEEVSNEIGSTLRTEGDYKISSFTLSGDQLFEPDETGAVTYHLTPQDKGDERKYDGKISAVDAQSNLCEIMIPLQDRIPDGNYTLKFRTKDNRFLNTQLSVAIRSEMVSRLVESTFIYGCFSEKGTADDPYRVTGDGFFDFLYALRKDPAHGEGSYFLQTENIKANKQGDDADGRGFANESFAGTYDGGGYTLELTYTGTKGSSDHAVGLFRELKDKAMVKNLVLDANFLRIVDTVGVVAAFSTGNVVLENITAKGSVTDVGSRIGGLIGVARDGTVAIRSSDPQVQITSARDEVGGLIGRVENAVLTVTDTYNDEDVPFKIIEGNESVGGAVGSLKGSFMFSKVGFSHTISQQDQSLMVIHGSRYTGGLIGKAEIDADCSLSQVTVSMPIYGDDYTGGFIGQLTKTGKGGLSIDFSAVKQSGGVVSGHNCVGGFIGYADIDFAEFNPNTDKKSLLGVQIKGSQQIGGIFGYCRTGKLKFNPGLKVEANISGTTGVGGFAGYLTCETSIQLDENLEFVPTMDVSGTQNVGGFAGWVEKTEISGKTIVTPDPVHGATLSQAISVYPGKVNGETRGYSALNSGGVIGLGAGVTLKQLYVTGSVYGQSYVGGIAGRLESSSAVVSCASRCGEFKGNYLGGLVGYLSGSNIERLANYSTISGSFYVGGIVGYLAGGLNIGKCVNFGTVNGDLDLGGIAGYGDKSAQYIDDCVNFGAVVCNASPFEDSGIGGIMGKNLSQCTIRGCANHGNISVSRGDRNLHVGVGGIAGYLGAGSTSADDILVHGCCNRGKIETTAGSAYRNRLGGIVGYMRGGTVGHDNTVQNCYNRGAVSGASQQDNGGITGTSNNYTGAVYSINTGRVESGNGGVGHRDTATDGVKTDGLYIEKGSGKNWHSTEFLASDKSQKSTFPKLDFNATWDVDGTTNDGYPFLRNCYYQFAVAPQ